MKKGDKILGASQEAVKKDAPSRLWPVYVNYKEVEEGGEPFVIAQMDFFEELADGDLRVRERGEDVLTPPMLRCTLPS